MHRIDWTFQALADLDRLQEFLAEKNELSAERAVIRVIAAVGELVQFPDRGRPAVEPGYRELTVRFSSSGYLVLYQVKDGTVRVIRIRHQREAGY